MADDTKNTPDQAPDLTSLRETYEIAGELGGHDHTRSYVGRRLEDGRDALITVIQTGGDVAAGKSLAQFAADAKLLERISHPHVPRVFEGRWIGDDAFALITERVQGTTLAELMRGDRISNARIADILGDVEGVLKWARDEHLSHRGVTPEGITIERGTNKVLVSLSPTDAPRTNRPDPRDDARTVGLLAVSMFSAKPIGEDHDGTLGSMRPDLPARVVDATTAIANVTGNDAEPNVSTYIATVAMADAIKEGEMEVARIDAEFRAQMQAEREVWAAEQAACQAAFEAQAQKFAGERADYERRSAKEREQLAAARAEIESRREEVHEARAELDEARREYKEKKSQLEARAKDVERRARSIEKLAHRLEEESADLGRSLNVPVTDTESTPLPERVWQRMTQPLGHWDEDDRTTQPVVQISEDEIPDPPADTPISASVSADNPPASTDYAPEPWRPIDSGPAWSVPLETDEPVAAMARPGVRESKSSRVRPRWMAPTGILVGALVLIGGGYGLSRMKSAPVVVAAASPAVAPKPDSSTTPTRPLVDSAGGVIGTILPPDSADLARVRDSIANAAERRALRARRAKALADSIAAVKRDSLKADSLRVKPDTARIG